MTYTEWHSRAARFLIGFLAGGALGFSSIRFHHRCELGYKWLESYSPLVLFALGIGMALVIPRYRVSLPLSVALAATIHFIVAPAYGHWVHDLNNPHFADQRAKWAERKRRMQATMNDVSEARTLPTPTPPLAK